MNRAWGIGLGLALAAAALASMPQNTKFGRVIVTSPDSSGDLTATINIRSWEEESLAADIDSALQAVRSAEVLGLLFVPCDEADSTRIRDVAGRLTPFNLSHLPKSGPWQWDRPLIILMNDSAYCPILLRLSERRWTTILIGDGSAEARKAACTDLLRRYKRERVDRLEEMFRRER